MTSYHVEIKSGGKGTAKDHAKYIAREGKYRKHEDMIDSGYGNMPQWAQCDPGAFWRAADLYERSNAAAYRELVIAIPNEFNPVQNIAFAERAIAELIGDRPYQYAIHAPEAKLGEVPNTHMHLMYSDRMPDGIQRRPEQTFKRYNPKQPNLGGCKKGSGGKSRMELRDEVIARRKLVADIQNQMLVEAGSEASVDHRSHKERGIKHKPERHLGPARINRMSKAEKMEYISAREPA